MDHVAVDGNRATGNLFKTCHAVDQSGFAALAGTEQNEKLIFPHVQVDFFDDINDTAGSVKTF